MHTPGPWVVQPSTGSLGNFQIEAGLGNAPTYVAECIGGLEDHEQEANARLIAAAPELLEALREAASFVDRHSEPWYTSGQELLAKIDAAIAKASTGAA